MEVTKWPEGFVTGTVTGCGSARDRWRMGISTLRDRVSMTAAMLVLEPTFEADLIPELYACWRARGAPSLWKQREVSSARLGKPPLYASALRGPVRRTISSMSISHNSRSEN